ncbi:hypothetical protein Fmac_017888 [Flemingia macrophylla]|uniref:Uncharacterized protein n=1 Tax=Flemingia macrophylla TaxID=520843 RepID=A0ABD1M3C6_9FABA
MGLHAASTSTIRNKKNEDALKKCTKAMLGLDQLVRASYNVHKLGFNRNHLAKIILALSIMGYDYTTPGSVDA